MKKKSRAIGGLLLVLVISLLVTGCAKRALKNEETDITNTANTVNEITNSVANDITNNVPNVPSSDLPDPDLASIEATKELADATLLAQGIQKDVVLAAVSTKYINSLSDITGLSTNYYIFISPSKIEYYYLVNMPRNGLEKPKRFIMLTSDFSELGFSILSVPFEYWKINYAQALQSAERAGGTKFRTDHKNFEVSEILARPAGGTGESYHLQWHIEYTAKDGTGTKFRVQVHANTGNVTPIP